MSRFVITVVLAAALAGPAMAQTAAAPPPAAPQLAIEAVTAKSSHPLTVMPLAFAPGGDIPFENTMYRGNTFPGLTWSKGPYGTKSYAIVMQDPDSKYLGAYILHWTMFNIPAGLTRLEAGMTIPPVGSSYGPNVRGPKHAYMGPHTPPGPKHHYHFQVFALDTVLPDEASQTYAGLISAMTGHALAEGEVIGLAQADPNAPPRVPAPATPPKP